jgi:predicted  nucleic acid-binding Zn-ribbon protein
MKLDKAGQSALLKLSEVDLEIDQIKSEINKAISSQELSDVRAVLSKASEDLLVARTAYENLHMDQRKADDNLHLVEERIARDRIRLNQTSSPKDAQGMQSEIESLLKRKEELEDAELEILEQLEAAQRTLNEVTQHRDELAAKIDRLQSEIQVHVDELKVRGRKLSADKEILVSKISAEVLTRYQGLSAKQIAVGVVENRACSACRMGLTASTIDSLSSLAEDELGSCPECLAMIVR